MIESPEPGEAATPALRVPVKADLRIQFEDRAAGFVDARAANISLTGMFVRTRRPRPAGTRLRFELKLSDGSLVTGVGEVVWTRLKEESEARPAGMGVLFFRLDEGGQKIVSVVVESHLLRATQESRMAASAPDRPLAAPRAALLLPIAYLLHLAEEWYGGFGAWTLAVLGKEVSPDRFVIINASAFLVFAVGTLAAVYSPRVAWLGTSFAALFGLNGVLHTLATLGFGVYSPGTFTGLLLYVPLSAVVLRSSSARLSGAVFAGSVVLGVLLHGLVAFLAFL